MSKKQTYTVVQHVQQASGTTTYLVEAESPEEARRLVASGAVECTDEEVSIDAYDSPDEWEVFDEKNNRCE